MFPDNSTPLQRKDFSTAAQLKKFLRENCQLDHPIGCNYDGRGHQNNISCHLLKSRITLAELAEDMLYYSQVSNG